MRKVFLYAALAILLMVSCKSSIELPEGISYSIDNNILIIKDFKSGYKISALSQDIINVSYSDSITYSDRIYGPILSTAIPLTLKEMNNKLLVSTENVRVEISFSPIHISFYDLQSGLKLQEEEGYTRNHDTTAFRFRLNEEEAIYGTGSRAIPQNRRGYKFQCFNQANYGYGVGTDFLNYSIPAYLSSEKYMIFIDNPARAWFDIGKTNTDVLDFSSLGGNMSYYFINGDSYKEVLTNYGKLTGTQPIPPIWAFGNLQSRFGYRSQNETEAVVNEMVEAGYPLDAIIIDIYWFGEEMQDGYMGNLSWDKKHWPTPDKMIKDFADKGVKTITVSEPFFTKKSQHFQYMSDNKLLGLDSLGNTLTMPYFYFGDAGLLDIFKPEARDWLWQQYKKEKERGIAGWWGDLGEPEVHPDEMVHVNGLAREVHGVYGHEWISTLYENYEKDYPNERLFKLGRAGYAGSQRYGLLPWSGDVGRNWSGFRAQNNVMIGMGLSGMPYMHSDAGGFAQGKRDSLLYMRWLQYAVFTPIFRPHGDPFAPPEPIFYHESIQAIVMESIKLRYAMLPYNYTLAWKTSQTNLPMARPLFFEFEEQRIADTITDVYMWGEDLLVAPILYPNATTRRLYLPEGDWYSFNTNKYEKGGAYIEEIVNDKTIPVFVRGGSFIPMAEVVQTIDMYKADDIVLKCYLNKDKNDFSGLIYFDDGKLKDAYQKGEYELLNLRCKSNKTELLVSYNLEGNSYEGAPEVRRIQLEVTGMNSEPESVLVNNETHEFTWENSILVVKGLTTSEETTISIQ